MRVGVGRREKGSRRDRERGGGRRRKKNHLVLQKEGKGSK